jgi:nucleotide-binding universal stress UspA family protein
MATYQDKMRSDRVIGPPAVLVVGFDFSPLAELALWEAAATAARDPYAIIHVVYAVEHNLAKAEMDRVEAEMSARMKTSIEAALRAARGDHGVRIFAHIRRGPAAHEILAVASEVEADLILVGTHGRSGVARLILGSVADKVMRIATCPVMIMRPRHYPPELVPEPACPTCVAVRASSGGARWWCDEHSRPHPRPHRYSYSGGDLRPYHADGLG